MTKKFLFGAAVVFVVAGFATSNVSALCNPPKFASTFNAGTYAYTYFTTTITGATSLVGRVWSPAGDHTGTCNTDGPFLYFGADPTNIGLAWDGGRACVPGCPSGSFSLQVTVGNASGTESLVTTTPENFAGLNFDFSARGHAMGSSKPKVTTSSRVGNTVSLNITVDPPAVFDGAAADVTGVNILSASGLTDPGRNAAAYAPKATLPATGGAIPLTFDCTLTPALQDVWIVTQLATLTGGANPTVSGATRVKCNSSLANPKYTVVPKKSMGTSTQH